MPRGDHHARGKCRADWTNLRSRAPRVSAIPHSPKREDYAAFSEFGRWNGVGVEYRGRARSPCRARSVAKERLPISIGPRSTRRQGRTAKSGFLVSLCLCCPPGGTVFRVGGCLQSWSTGTPLFRGGTLRARANLREDGPKQRGRRNTEAGHSGKSQQRRGFTARGRTHADVKSQTGDLVSRARRRHPSLGSK